jgi:hypothetical protein
MVQELFEKLIVTQLAKKYHSIFMEPEGSLPCSQKVRLLTYLFHDAGDLKS